ncbi:MAG: hypothetical protein OQJ95_06155 [Kangiella sp.]|nr:hypothetical protein [Kangiella sp.]
MNAKSGSIIIFGAAAVFAALYAFLIFSSQLSYSEMDLNRNGVVSYEEALKFFDVGVRLVMVEGKECTEYYALKDGLPVEVVCESSKL